MTFSPELIRHPAAATNRMEETSYGARTKFVYLLLSFVTSKNGEQPLFYLSEVIKREEKKTEEKGKKRMARIGENERLKKEKKKEKENTQF